MTDTNVSNVSVKSAGDTAIVEDIVKEMVEISSNTDHPMTKVEAKRAFDTVKNAILSELTKGCKIQITGFLSINPIYKPSRTVFNIATGQPMETKERIVINAKVGGKIRNIAEGYDETVFNAYKTKHELKMNKVKNQPQE